MKLLSIVVSAYNEEAGLRQFYRTTSGYAAALTAQGWDYEFVFVNDGSADRTGRSWMNCQRRTRCMSGYCISPGTSAMKRP